MADFSSSGSVVSHVESGTASASASTTISDSTKAWGTNIWANYVILIGAGTGSGQSRTISSNTATVITVDAAWATNPDTTSQYGIFTSGGGEEVQGIVAEDGAASGNPVGVGGRYDSSARSLDDGDRGEIAISAAGAVVIDAGDGIVVTGPAADDAAASGNPVQVAGVVDESPASRSEGDIVPLVMSAEGDLHVQPSFEGANIASATGVFVQGPAADDAAASGNPLLLGGLVDDSSPNTGNEGDVKTVRVSPEGNVLAEIYWGNGSVFQGASVDVNEGISADVEPAVAATAGLRLVGWSMRESAGSAAVATFRIMHGANVSGGTGVVTVELAADGSAGDWYGPEGILCTNGITIDRIAGTADVYIYHKTLT